MTRSFPNNLNFNTLALHEVSQLSHQSIQQPTFTKELYEFLSTLFSDDQLSGPEVIQKIKTFFSQNNYPLSDGDLTRILTTMGVQNARSYDPKKILTARQLHPELTKRITAVLEETQTAGLEVFIFEGFRTPQRQSEIQKKTPKSTKAGPGYSFHNYGLASDIVFYDKNGNPSWDSSHDWKQLGAIGKKYGLTWGGDFKSFKDLAHFEYHPQMSIQEVRTEYNKGGIKQVWKKISEMKT